jgi:hypothetical protein
MEARIGDIGTPERHMRGELTTAVVDSTRIGVVRNISPLNTMYKRKQINTAQYSAGNYLYECYINGWIGRNKCIVAERTDGGIHEMTDKQVHYLHQYCKGMAAAGSENMLIRQVCLNEIALTTKNMGGTSKRKLKVRLCNTLNEIAKVYHML